MQANFSGNLVNESGECTKTRSHPKFSDLEVVALNMASEAVGIDSESLLFAKLQEYRVEIPNLISRRQYNDRRKITSSYVMQSEKEWFLKWMVVKTISVLIQKPIEVCRIAVQTLQYGKEDF